MHGLLESRYNVQNDRVQKVSQIVQRALVVICLSEKKHYKESTKWRGRENRAAQSCQNILHGLCTDK